MPRKTDLELINETLDALKEENLKLTQPPLHSAEFLQMMAGGQAVVLCGSQSRLVTVLPGIDLADLPPGHEVWVNQERNCIVSRASDRRGSGDLSEFERLFGDDRAIVRFRDTEIVVQLPAPLRGMNFRHGDPLRIREGWALEKVERMEPELPPDDLPDVSPESIGGQQECVKRLLRAATCLLIDPKRAKRYGLGKKGRTIVLSGPPGCGKTLMATACAAEIRRLSGNRCEFFVVRPGEFDRMHVGEGEGLINGTFNRVTKAAERNGQAMIYIDELDGVGAVRGQPGNVHGDRYTGLLLSRIDGVKSLGNVLILSSCNALDRVDPALLERLSGIHIRVPRPGLKAAREIFRVHLPGTLPFSPNGASAQRTREELIDSAAARLCGPQAEVIATVKFKNGKEEVLQAGRFLSGRLIQQVCVDASETAFYAEPDREEPGVQLGDMLDAVEAAVDRLRVTVTSNNIRALVDDLPEDQAIAAVEPAKRTVKRAHRFMN
ncbi:MAG: AAA family ATPase [Chthoniobacteraceae bacterium]